MDNSTQSGASASRLEKLLTPVRLSWHGAALIAAGVVGEVVAYEASRHGMWMADVLIFPSSCFVIGVGIAWYEQGYNSYRKVSKALKEEGCLDAKFLNKHLKHYCNRQGARTAAANQGLLEEYEEILASYDGPMYHPNLPNL
jgi:hypothetical protein